MEPQVGVIVTAEPGGPPKFAHHHTMYVTIGLVFPTNDETVHVKVQEVFKDPVVVQEIQHAVLEYSSDAVMRTAMEVLARHGIVYESHLRQFQGTPK